MRKIEKIAKNKRKMSPFVTSSQFAVAVAVNVVRKSEKSKTIARN